MSLVTAASEPMENFISSCFGERSYFLIFWMKNGAFSVRPGLTTVSPALPNVTLTPLCVGVTIEIIVATVKIATTATAIKMMCFLSIFSPFRNNPSRFLLSPDDGIIRKSAMLCLLAGRPYYFNNNKGHPRRKQIARI